MGGGGGCLKYPLVKFMLKGYPLLEKVDLAKKIDLPLAPKIFGRARVVPEWL